MTSHADDRLIRDWHANGESSLCLLLQHSNTDQNDDYIPVICQRLAQLARDQVPDLTDVIPGRDSITIISREPANLTTIRDSIDSLVDLAASQAQESSGTLHDIPVSYDDRLGNDIDELSRVVNLSRDEIIHRHLSKTYRLDMLGFLPGFLYLSGLDESLMIPRKSTPAISVAAGSVAIAENMSGIYSLSSPGGWWVIGRTPVRIFKLDQNPPVTLQPLDHIRFYQIDYQEWLREADD